MHPRIPVLILALVVTLSVPVRAGESTSRIGVDDVLQIRTIAPTGLNSNESYRVDGNGFIRHSVVGRVKLIDLSADQAETFLERYLVRFGVADAAVKINVIASNGLFTVMGKVKKPGEYAVRGKTTVADAIAKAGGLEKPSTGEFVRLSRKGSTTKNFSLASRGSMLVRPGDEITVLK